MSNLNKLSWRTFLFTTILMLWVGISSAQDQTKWTGHIEFFAKPGTDRSIAKGDLFLPLQQSEDFLLFGNLKANFDDRSYKEGNAGIGARKLYDNWIVGGWLFYDWKESSTSNTFDQVTIGGEFLSNDWDLRANAYFAEDKVKDADDASIVELNGNQIQARLGEERALPGFDAEVGRKLPFLEDSRFFVGGYYYDASGFKKVSGPRLRLEMRFHDLPLFSSILKGSRLTLGAEYIDDSVRGSQTFGLLQLRIPFGGKQKNKRSLTKLERRMVETVQRDDDIITNERVGDEIMPMINPKTGQVISVVETIDASTANVAATVAAAGQNSLIIADGTQGGIALGGTTINTQPGQIITGGGQQISLQAKKSDGKLIDMMYTPSGQRSNISRSGSGELIYVNNDDNVTINGVDLEGGRPIRINNSQNVCVLNSNVLNSAANRQGVYVHSNSNVNFENLSIMNTGREGVLMASNSTADINNLRVANSGREGIYLTSNSSAVLRDVNISNTNREGIRIRSGSSVSAANVAISKTGSEAVEVNNSILNLRNATISDIDVNANRDGIYATNGSTLNLNNVLIDNVTSQGIITSNTNSSITNVTVRNTGHQGLYAYNNSTTNLTNVDIDNAGRQGIYTRGAKITAADVNITNANNQGLFLYNTTANIDGLQITNAGQQGIYLYNNTDATIDNLTVNNSVREGLYVRNSDLTLNSASISNITATANRDAIYIYRNSNVIMNDVSVANVTGDGMQVQGTNAQRPNVTITDLSISDVGRFGVVNTRGNITLNNASITNTVFDGILVNRGDMTVNSATVSSVGRFGIYALRSNAAIQNLTVSNTANDGVLSNRSTLSLDNSTIRDIGNGNPSDDAIQVINSTLSGAGNRIEGAIDSGVACRSSGANSGSIVFSVGPITSCP